MDEEKRKKQIEQVLKKRRRLAMINNSPDLTLQEVVELSSLKTQLNKFVSNENVEKFVNLGLAKHALGGLMITDLGRLAVLKNLTAKENNNIYEFNRASCEALF